MHSGDDEQEYRVKGEELLLAPFLAQPCGRHIGAKGYGLRDKTVARLRDHALEGTCVGSFI